MMQRDWMTPPRGFAGTRWDWIYPPRISPELIYRGMYRLRWYHVPQMDLIRYVYLTPRAVAWWSMAAWRFVLGPFFRLLIRLGMWEVPPGYRYTAGRAPWMHIHEDA